MFPRYIPSSTQRKWSSSNQFRRFGGSPDLATVVGLVERTRGKVPVFLFGMSSIDTVVEKMNVEKGSILYLLAHCDVHQVASWRAQPTSDRFSLSLSLFSLLFTRNFPPE